MLSAKSLRTRSLAIEHGTQLAAGALALVIGILYCRSFSGYFLADDFANIAVCSQYDLRRWPGLFLRDVSEGIWGFSLNALRPFAALAMITEGHLFGAHPLPYRLTNLALHFINACLVFALTRRLVSDNRAIAFAAALLFAVHPVQVEPVIWIAGQSDLTPTALFLGAFLAFLRFRSSERTIDAALCAVLGFLAIFTKENCVVLPLLFAGYDFLYARDLRPLGSRRAIVRTLGPYIIYGAILLAYFICRRIAFGTDGAGPRLRGVVGTILKTFPSRYADYFSHLFAPVDLSVAIFLLLFLVVPLLVLTLKPGARATIRSLLFTGGVWFCVTTLPFLLTYSSSRHLYVVSAGFCIFLTAFAHLLTGRRLIATALLLATIACVWSWTSLKRSTPWIHAGWITRQFHQQIEQLAKTPKGTALLIDLPEDYKKALTLAWAVPFVLDPPFHSPGLRDHFTVLAYPASYYAPQLWAKNPAIEELTHMSHSSEAYVMTFDRIPFRVEARRVERERVCSAADGLANALRADPAAPPEELWKDFIAVLAQ